MFLSSIILGNFWLYNISNSVLYFASKFLKMIIETYTHTPWTRSKKSEFLPRGSYQIKQAV